MAEAPRKRRPQPKRTAPIRRAAASGSKPIKVADGQEPDEDLDLAVSDAVAQAVRLGYKVLAENLEEGRAAAKQFRVGEYSIRDVPNDLNLLAKRMVNLARDLSTTTYDLLDRVLQDPGLISAVRRFVDAVEPAAPAARMSVATRSNSPAKTVVKSGAKGGATNRATSSPANPPPPTTSIPLTCRFSGSAKARTLTSWLSRPDSHTPLASAGLTTLEAGAPAIAGITFHASDDGSGVIADIVIPADQAAGVYSGAVVSADTGEALGALTIQVGA